MKNWDVKLALWRYRAVGKIYSNLSVVILKCMKPFINRMSFSMFKRCTEFTMGLLDKSFTKMLQAMVLDTWLKEQSMTMK